MVALFGTISMDLLSDAVGGEINNHIRGTEMSM
jgi:hypothetical protein